MHSTSFLTYLGGVAPIFNWSFYFLRQVVFLQKKHSDQERREAGRKRNDREQGGLMAGRSERKRGRRCDGRNGNNSIPFASPPASSTPSQRSLSRTLSSFPINSPSSLVPFRRAITSPPPLPAMLHFHNPSLSRSLHPIFPPFPPASSFPSSSFLPRCFSVLLSLCPPTHLGVRSLLSQPHSEAHPGHHKPAPNFECLRCDLSLYFSFLFCSHGLLLLPPRTALFAWRPCSHHAHWNAFPCSSLLAA